jgi:hypothetical protein
VKNELCRSYSSFSWCQEELMPVEQWQMKGLKGGVDLTSMRDVLKPRVQHP